MALGKRKLLLHQLLDLLLHDLLVEELAAGDAIDLRAQRGDAVLVVMLHAGLACHGGADQVVAQDEIGGGGKVADGEHAGKAEADGGHPGADGHVTDLVAACQDHDMPLRALSEDAVFRTLRHPFTPRPILLVSAWENYTLLGLIEPFAPGLCGANISSG